MRKLLILMSFIIMLLPSNIFAVTDNASSSILMDTDSTRILYSKNIHKIRSVASISKIMTAITAIEAGNLHKTITIKEDVLKAYGSGIYVKVGEKLKLIDLLYGLMLRSGNDAALAIASSVSGNTKNFVKQMNQKAIDIGMNNTTFNNPSGLDEDKEIGNFSTAYDMAILTSYCMQNKIFRDITKTKKYVLKTNKNTYIWHNKNKLLTKYKYTTGGKTGFTKKARRTLISTASKDNLNLVVVTFNDGSDFSDHINIHNYGFDNYKKYILLKKGPIKIKKDNYYKNDVLYINKNLSVALNNSEVNNIKLKYNLIKVRKVKNNNIVGNVEVILDDEVLATTNIIYKDKKIFKEKRNFFDWFKNLW